MSDVPFQPGEQVVIYLRDSGGTNQEDSIERQTQEITRWCQKHQLIITHQFADEARSGRDVQKRERLLEMMDHFRRGGAEAGVIIWNYARFARNTKHGRFFLAELEYLDKRVFALTDNIPEGPEKILFQAFKLYAAEQVSDKIAEDVTSGLRRLVELHRCVPGTPPRGFMREPVQIGLHRNGKPRIAHKWVPDPVMVPLVQRAFEMRAKGHTTQQIIAATGLYKSAGCYTTFFSNRIYIGEFNFADLTIPDYCEPMIDRATWDDVQRINQRRKLPQLHIDHPRRIVSSFILSGLLYCQECGAPMSGYSVKGWEYYVCSRRKTKHDCSARRIPRAPIEAEIMHLLEDRVLSLDVLLLAQSELQNLWNAQAGENENAKREVNKQLEAVKKKIRNITNAIAEAGPSAALLKGLKHLEEQESNLRADLARISEWIQRPPELTTLQLSELAEQLKAELHEENKTRAVLRGLVARVIARRTDDQIIGVLYCNQVNGQVPPRGGEAMTLLYPLVIPVRKHKAPLRH